MWVPSLACALNASSFSHLALCTSTFYLSITVTSCFRAGANFEASLLDGYPLALRGPSSTVVFAALQIFAANMLLPLSAEISQRSSQRKQYPSRNPQPMPRHGGPWMISDNTMISDDTPNTLHLTSLPSPLISPPITPNHPSRLLQCWCSTHLETR